MTVLSPDNVPGQGGALQVGNRVSFVDMLLILANTHRFVRFLPHLDVRDHWGVSFSCDTSACATFRPSHTLYDRL